MPVTTKNSPERDNASLKKIVFDLRLCSFSKKLSVSPPLNPFSGAGDDSFYPSLLKGFSNVSISVNFVEE